MTTVEVSHHAADHMNEAGVFTQQSCPRLPLEIWDRVANMLDQDDRLRGLDMETQSFVGQLLRNYPRPRLGRIRAHQAPPAAHIQA